MYRIWTERPVPTLYLALFDDVATLSGPATATPDAPLSALPSAQAILAGAKIVYDGALMDQVPTLRVISRVGIGVDNIVISDATARGILIVNTPDGPTISTAEHALALLFAVTKRIRAADQASRTGTYSDFISREPGVELLGQRLGLVGFGRIGRHVAKVALALGMIVSAYDPLIPPARIQELGVELAPTLEILLGSADLVSLHVPVTAETRNLMNTERFTMMKARAILINAARGGLVDEQALWQALESGHLRGAGLDVLQVEPPDPANPLVQRDDVVITPHIASSTAAGLDRMWRTAIAQVLQVLNGKRPANIINPEAWRLL